MLVTLIGQRVGRYLRITIKNHKSVSLKAGLFGLIFVD